MTKIHITDIRKTKTINDWKKYHPPIWKKTKLMNQLILKASLYGKYGKLFLVESLSHNVVMGKWGGLCPPPGAVEVELQGEILYKEEFKERQVVKIKPLLVWESGPLPIG